jgi:hypothetical protein
MARSILSTLVSLPFIGPDNMKKIFIYNFILVILFAGLILKTDAAVLYTAQPEAAAGSEYIVDVVIDADLAVNTVQVSLNIPSGLQFVRANDSNSIINLWIDKPAYNAQTKKLTLSGLTPGGFSGLNGHIISLVFSGSVENNQVITFDQANTLVYLNDGNGTKDGVRFSTKVRQAVASSQDTIGPESFTPIITRDAQLHDGKWVVLFQTQDKGSGIDHYEVQESTRRTPNENNWKRADSPYVLEDQNVSKYVFVKAVDAQGNETIAVVQAESMSFGFKLFIILCIALGIYLISKVYYRNKKRS